MCRILKETSVPTDYGQLSFDADGVRTHADFDIYNLVPDPQTGNKQWKVANCRVIAIINKPNATVIGVCLSVCLFA